MNHLFAIWTIGYVVSLVVYGFFVSRLKDRRGGEFTIGAVIFAAWPIAVPYVVIGTAYMLMKRKQS